MLNKFFFMFLKFFFNLSFGTCGAFLSLIFSWPCHHSFQFMNLLKFFQSTSTWVKSSFFGNIESLRPSFLFCCLLYLDPGMQFFSAVIKDHFANHHVELSCHLAHHVTVVRPSSSVSAPTAGLDCPAVGVWKSPW